jgi:hypothetical protein
MSDRNSEPEKPTTSASAERNGSVSRAQGKFIGRRAMLKAVLATTPVVMTIKSRPASAQVTASAAATAKPAG